MEISSAQSSPYQQVIYFLLGVCFPLLIFLFLAIHVWQQGKGFRWDVSILLALHTAAHPILDEIALAVTPFGVFWGVFPAIAIIGMILFYRRNWRSLVYLVIASIGSMLLNRTIKLLFHRTRPQLWELLAPPDLTYAFPSGHAMASMTFAIVLTVLLWNTRWRWVTLVATSLFVLLIGWTRLYLGVHYPSDVLAGWSLALAWTLGITLLVRPQNLTFGNPVYFLKQSKTVEKN